MSEDIDDIIAGYEKRKEDGKADRISAISMADDCRGRAMAVLRDTVLPACQSFGEELESRGIPHGVTDEGLVGDERLGRPAEPATVIVWIGSPDKGERAELRVSHERNSEQIRYSVEWRHTRHHRDLIPQIETQGFEEVSAEFVRNRLVDVLRLVMS